MIAVSATSLFFNLALGNGEASANYQDISIFGFQVNTKAVLAATGAQRILSIESITARVTSKGVCMFIEAELARAPSAGGIPEGTMRQDLFIVEDRVKGIVRTRISDSSFLIDLKDVSNGGTETPDHFLRTIESQDLLKVPYSYDNTKAGKVVK